MSAAVATVVGGILILVLGCLFKTVHDLRTTMQAGFVELMRGQGKIDARLASMEHRLVASQADLGHRIDALARRLERRVEDERFRQVNRRFGGIDRQLVGLATTLGEVNEKVDRHLSLPHSA